MSKPIYFSESGYPGEQIHITDNRASRSYLVRQLSMPVAMKEEIQDRIYVLAYGDDFPCNMASVKPVKARILRACRKKAVNQFARETRRLWLLVKRKSR